MATHQLANSFVSKNGELTEKSKTLTPIRKECKTLQESIMQSMQQSGQNEIVLQGGHKICLQRKESPVPLKQEYLESKLTELMQEQAASRGDEGIAKGIAALWAQRIWEQRPVKPTLKLKLVKDTSASSTTTRKRTRDLSES
jgi:hypothetical protein